MNTGSSLLSTRAALAIFLKNREKPRQFTRPRRVSVMRTRPAVYDGSVGLTSLGSVSDPFVSCWFETSAELDVNSFVGGVGIGCGGLVSKTIGRALPRQLFSQSTRPFGRLRSRANISRLRHRHSKVALNKRLSANQSVPRC